MKKLLLFIPMMAIPIVGTACGATSSTVENSTVIQKPIIPMEKVVIKFVVYKVSGEDAIKLTNYNDVNVVERIKYLLPNVENDLFGILLKGEPLPYINWVKDTINKLENDHTKVEIVWKEM